MSVLTTIADAVGITPSTKAVASVDQINEKIVATKSRIAQLERDYSAACLTWADDPSKVSVRDKASADLHAARVDLASLHSALAMAKERNSQDERRRLAALNASRVASMTSHLRAAEKAATELADALTKAAAARVKLLEKSAKARLSSPSPLPKGSLTEAGVIDALIAGELHRLSYVAGAPGKPSTGSLPGSKPPTLSAKDDPASITPLVDQLRQSHDWAIGVVKGEIAVERTPLVEAQIAAGTAKLDAVADGVMTEPPGDFNPADLVGPPQTAEQIMAGMKSRKVAMK